MSRKILLGLGALIFAAFAALQVNDATQYGNNDAWIWIALYGIAALLSAFSIFRRLPKHWLSAWAGFSWGCLLFRLQDELGNFHLSRLNPANYWDATGTTMVQNSNESGGLLIVALWACLLIYLNGKR